MSRAKLVILEKLKELYHLHVHALSDPTISYAGYTLTYEKKGETITRVTRELGPLVTNYTISGLTATTHYTIVIYAKTRVGNGPPTSADIQSGIPPGKDV